MRPTSRRHARAWMCAARRWILNRCKLREAWQSFQSKVHWELISASLRKAPARRITWILRPTGFEFTAAIETSIAARALEFTQDVARSVPCVDFTKLEDFISKHRRAARLIASLRARNDLARTSPRKLKRRCKQNDINIVEENGRIYPQRGCELAFLELLDRRRYTVELVDDSEELYLAGNRRGISRTAQRIEAVD